MAKDPLINAIYLGIKAGISKTFDEKLFGPSLILIYTGIDMMAWLDMPAHQTDVTRSDFIRWVNTYFPAEFTAQVKPEELYSARCAVVHSYTVESHMTRGLSARMIGYKIGGYPPVNFNASINPQLLIIEIEFLMNEFFTAIDTFLMRAFSDKEKGALIDQRAHKLLNVIPFRTPPT